MKILVVEDDFTSRNIIQRFLAPCGEVDIAVDGEEALGAFRAAFEKNEPYQLICLDVMMPKLSGQDVLIQIREFEKERGIKYTDGVKIIMTTALGDPENVLGAFKNGCEAYVVKPISRKNLIGELGKLGLLD